MILGVSIWGSLLLTSLGEEDKGGKQTIVEAEAVCELQVLQEDARAPKVELAR